MAKRLMILVGMLAVLLAMAVPPATAQGVLPPGGITVTGVLEGLPSDGGPPVFGITDEASGQRYILEGGGSDISRLLGQRTYVEGVPRTDPNSSLRSLEVYGYTAADRAGPSSPPPGLKRVTLTYELEVGGDPPAGASFFGRIDSRGQGVSDVPLTDPDGDGIYTGSDFVNIPVPPEDSPPNAVTHPPTIQIVQGTGTQYGPPGVTYPGEPIRVVEDFGVVPLDEDKTFSARANFKEGRGDTTTPETTTPEESTAPGPTTGGDSDNSGGEKKTATATFKLMVEGQPPADATFFARGVYDPRVADRAAIQQLTDPDGDGVYTGTQATIPGDYDIEIVQGTGTKKCDPTFGGMCPGEPTRVIKDFGTVTLDEDKTFSASLSFEGGGGGSGDDGSTNGGSDNGGSGKVGSDNGSSSDNGGSDSGGSGGSGSSGSGNGGKTGSIRGLLPSTGGITPYALGVGALLVGGGLLVRKLAR